MGARPGTEEEGAGQAGGRPAGRGEEEVLDAWRKGPGWAAAPRSAASGIGCRSLPGPPGATEWIAEEEERNVPAVQGQGDQAGSRRSARGDVRGGARQGGVRRPGLAPVPQPSPHGLDQDRGAAQAEGLRPDGTEAG